MNKVRREALTTLRHCQMCLIPRLNAQPLLMRENKEESLFVVLKTH